MESQVSINLLNRNFSYNLFSFNLSIHQEQLPENERPCSISAPAWTLTSPWLATREDLSRCGLTTPYRRAKLRRRSLWLSCTYLSDKNEETKPFCYDWLISGSGRQKFIVGQVLAKRLKAREKIIEGITWTGWWVIGPTYGTVCQFYWALHLMCFSIFDLVWILYC